VALVRKAKSLLERDFVSLEQRALSDFINAGHLERHIKRKRMVYAKRRAALVQALTKHLGKIIAISPTCAGSHLLAVFSPSLRECDINNAARDAGLMVISTADHYVTTPIPNQFMIDFAQQNEDQTERKVADFADLLTKSQSASVKQDTSVFEGSDLGLFEFVSPTPVQNISLPS